MKWFRLYDELIDDHKIHELTDSEFRVFMYLMCLANRQQVRGVIPLDLAKTSRILRLHVNKVKPAIETLQKLNIISCNSSNPQIKFINWAKRQFESDDVYSRVKRFRNSQGNVTETAPDTDTDTDTEKKKENIKRKKKPFYTESFEEFWSHYPRKEGKGAAYKAYQKIKPPKPTIIALIQAIEVYQRSQQWKRDDGQFIPHAATWLNQRRWEDEPQKQRDWI